MDLVFLLRRLFFLFLLFPTLLLMPGPSSVASMVLPGCPSKCGSVEVPYPFGFREGCARDNTFLFTCNSTGYKSPQLFRGNINVTRIDLMGRLDVLFFIARNCFDQTGSLRNSGILTSNLRGWPYTISADYNRFTVTGCDSVAFIVDPDVKNGFWTGCASICKNENSAGKNNCSGIGCCQTSIPKGLKYYEARFQSFFNHTLVWEFNPCSLAFVVDTRKFVFNKSFLSSDYSYVRSKLPVVLDWAIEGEDCLKAKQTSTYACRSNNSYCLPSPNGLGYLCNCAFGYEGNPYLDDGCKDINECQNLQTYRCQGVCENIPGNYKCFCPSGYRSDDPKTLKCVADPVNQKFSWPLKLGIDPLP